MYPGRYTKLRDRMNVVFWRWYWAGRMDDAARLVRAFDSWWERECGNPRFDVRTGI